MEPLSLSQCLRHKTCIAALYSAFQNIKQNALLSFATMMTISLMFLLVYIAYSFQVVSKEFIHILSSKVDIIIELTEDASLSDVQPFLGEIQELSGIQEAVFHDKSELLEAPFALP